MRVPPTPVAPYRARTAARRGQNYKPREKKYRAAARAAAAAVASAGPASSSPDTQQLRTIGTQTSGGGGFDRPGVEQQLRQLAQTVIRIRQSAATGNLWEQLPEGTQLLLQEEMRRQRISHFGYLGQY